jgi:hypothetical protein
VADDGEAAETRQEARPGERFVHAVTDDATRQIALGEDILAVSGSELERLLASLRRLESRDAATLVEEIEALRLAGGAIRLTPTDAELAALRHALAAGPQPAGVTLLRRERPGAGGRPAEVRPT